MPTLKPRISITLEPEQIAILDRFATAAGRPRATLLAEMLGAVIPQLEKTTELMELAKAAPRQLVQDMVESLDNASTDAMGLLAGTIHDYQKVMTKVQPLTAPTEDRAEGTRMRGGAARTGRKGPNLPKNPHVLTGGSK